MWIAFDSDNSFAALGSKERQTQILGLPPVYITRGVDQIRSFIGKVVVPVERPIIHPLFGDTQTTETILELSPAAKEKGVKGIIIDTLSTVGHQTREAIMMERKLSAFDQQAWGAYGDKMTRFVHLLSKLAFPVIVNMHLERKQDEFGSPLDLPNIKGSTKDELPKFFDVIAFTRVSRDTKGVFEYTWQVRPDARRPIAKDRLSISEPFVPQDFTPFLEAYNKAGHHLKILVLGESGQGKTTALRTLNPILK